jgi:hypothetical protein
LLQPVTATREQLGKGKEKVANCKLPSELAAALAAATAQLHLQL